MDIPARLNLAQYCLGHAAAATPDKIALLVVADADRPTEAERWTYRDLDLAVRGVGAGLLANGLKAGDRLLLRLPNDANYALTFFGAIAAGIVPVPTSSQLTAREVEVLLDDSDAAAIVVAEASDAPAGRARIFDRAAIGRLKATPPIATYADTAAQAAAYIIYTSGTSGVPKGVVHAHRVVLGREPMRRSWEAIGPDDIMLHAGAFNWSYTLGVGLVDPWAVGATAVLYTGPRDIAVWPRLIGSLGATLFAAVPSLYRQMLKYDDLSSADLGSLRHGLAAGEALSPAIHDGWLAATGRELYEAFGMSECSTFVSSGPDVSVRLGSAGRPQPGRLVAVLPLGGDPTPLPPGETGLLAIHHNEPGLMLGYWRRPDEDEATRRGDWFVGGDLAEFDADGYLWHRGRADDVMNAGGYRVAPAEVEAALADCPGIAEVAVKEHSVREDVSIIAAFVVPTPGSAIDRNSVLEFAGTRLATYKRPREVFFVDALPRSANGKLLRRQLG